MTTNDDVLGEGRNSLGGSAGSTVGLVRLGIGLAQGIALYLLLRLTEGQDSWSSTHPGTFAPLILIALFVPPLLLAGAGKMRWLTLGMWAIIAASALALVGWHDVARQAADTAREPTPGMFAFSAAALFIAHHLILTADRARRPVGAYPAYFDAAWMAGVQLAASIAFAGAFWLLLLLGAALFNIIGLSFLGDLLEKGWFSLPLTGLAFATAVQLTDVREGLIRGVRSIALMLLSWLLLVLTVLIGGFLAALPFTGLSGLWDTGSATALLLSATGATIILINAAYQDGRDENLPPRVLQIAVQAASVLLVPLVGLAVWGLALRIGQHGLTPDRIIASACACVGALYAGGYAWAALGTFLRKSDWMKPLEPTNLIAALGAVLAILALFTPVADPSRLSVADQVARLERGAVPPDAFDFAFLRFQSGKVGEAALARLVSATNPAVAAKAREATTAASLGNLMEAQKPAERKIIVEPVDSNAGLPTDFLESQTLSDLPNCIAPGECVGLGRDLDKDGIPEILIARRSAIELFARDDTGWWKVGSYSSGRCSPPTTADFRDALRSGVVGFVAPRMPDLEIAGQRTEMLPSFDCLERSLPPAR